MTALLENPLVQSGAVPLLAGLIVALLLGRLRLGGLAVVAAFAAAVALITGFTFTPLTATRKIVLLGLAAAPAGVLADLLLRTGRVRAIALAVVAGAATLWTFWPILAQKPLVEAWLPGTVATLLVAWLVAATNGVFVSRPVEASVAALWLGVGAGALALLGASALFGQYGLALAAGAGGFLLVMMIRNRVQDAGSTLALPAALVAGLLASGALILAQLQWYAAALLALVPLAAWLQIARRSPVALRAVLLSLLAALPVVAAGALAYYAARGSAG
jgi:hypothetical protein